MKNPLRKFAHPSGGAAYFERPRRARKAYTKIPGRRDCATLYLLTIVLLAGCGSSGSSRAVVPFTRFLTPVAELRDGLEESIQSLRYPEGIWTISSTQ